MELQTIVFWLVFSVLTACGLGLKAKGLIPSSNDVAALSPYAKIEPALHEDGFRLLRIQKPTTDKNFVVHIYQKPTCSGWVALLPLVRNAEGAELLSTLFPQASTSPFFVLKGEAYPVFPSVRFWWSQVVTQISKWGAPNQKPIVWAIIESKSCANVSKFLKLL